MIAELIRQERMANFPLESYSSWIQDYFHLHCSPVFASCLKHEMTELALRSGFLVDKTLDEPEIKFTKYHIPNVGLLNIVEDMEQGYRLEKIGNLKQ